jgi:hypothetical protein
MKVSNGTEESEDCEEEIRMNIPFTGRCQCGAVSYECSEAPLFTAICYCTACQRTSGASCTAVLNVHISAVEISGKLRHSGRIGDTGQPVESAFCAMCGSRMFSYPAVLDGRMNIMATSLDDTSEFQPPINIYAASAPSWQQVDRRLPTFDTVPPPR